jgi:hypothetical protein
MDPWVRCHIYPCLASTCSSEEDGGRRGLLMYGAVYFGLGIVIIGAIKSSSERVKIAKLQSMEYKDHRNFGTPFLRAWIKCRSITLLLTFLGLTWAIPKLQIWMRGFQCVTQERVRWNYLVVAKEQISKACRVANPLLACFNVPPEGANSR